MDTQYYLLNLKNNIEDPLLYLIKIDNLITSSILI